MLLHAAKWLQDRGRSEIRFLLVGGGSEEGALRKLSAQLGLRHVEFRGLVPKKDICDVMAEADGFVATLKDVPLLKYGISLNKICDYLASGRPSILSGQPGYDPIFEARAGISVAAEDPEALGAAVEALLALQSAERLQMGKNGLEYLERVHGVNVLADRLENALLRAEKHSGFDRAAETAARKERHSVYETRL